MLEGSADAEISFNGDDNHTIDTSYVGKWKFGSEIFCVDNLSEPPGSGVWRQAECEASLVVWRSPRPQVSRKETHSQSTIIIKTLNICQYELFVIFPTFLYYLLQIEELFFVTDFTESVYLWQSLKVSKLTKIMSVSKTKIPTSRNIILTFKNFKLPRLDATMNLESFDFISLWYPSSIHFLFIWKYFSLRQCNIFQERH